MEPTSWGDEGTVSLISMMWNITITVVEMEPGEKPDDPHKFIQLKLRHSRPLNDVDLVLVLAGHKHYLGTCEYIFQFCPSAFWSVRCGGGRSCVVIGLSVRQ